MKKLLRYAALALVILLVFAGLQRLFMPKYMGGIYEGAMLAEYYSEPKNHQVVFVGDCEVYENFSPITLWEQYGITSYIRGGPQQLIWQSYYILEDTLRYEKPDVVVYNVLSMKHSQPVSEAYNRLNIDGMRLSRAKIGAIQASMMPEESLLSYLFPLLRYHSRWAELSTQDLQYFWQAQKVSHNGFMMRADIKPVGVIPEGKPLPDYTFSDICYEYLNKMAALCKENGVKLVLVKAPSLYPYWYDEWDAQMVQYAQENGLDYINFLNHTEEIGLDFSTDTYDAGLHLNLYGAEKLSVYFGEYITKRYNLPDMRQNETVAKLWQQKTAAYYQMAQAQQQEFEQEGKISTFTY